MPLFDEFGRKDPELKSQIQLYPESLKEGDKVKPHATYKRNYDMNSSHYIILEGWH